MRRALLILFFLTGATALGYQLVWARMLANTLGHEMPAVLAVVGTFMGGMTLGAWGLGGAINRSQFPGRWYAALEIFISLWASFVTPTHPLVLLPATMAMGATFPAMARFIRPLVTDGRYVGGLYACNTLGAVAGILAVTWWVIPQIGLRRSSLVLAGLNLVVGAIAWPLACRRTASEPVSPPTDRHLMTSVFATGFLAIGFEILGVRVLAQVTENTVYSFAAALAVYLVGTSFGAGLYQRFGHERWLNNLLVGTTTACLGSIFVMSRAQAIYNGSELVLALSVFLLPTMMMGALFSLLMQRQPGRLPKMLAVNTLGSALSPFVFGVLLLPQVGSKVSLMVVALSYLTLVTQWRWVLAAPLAMLPFLPDLRFIQGSVVDYREGVMASVAVVRDAAGDRTLKVNNRFQMGGTSAAATEYRQAHLPLLLHPKPQRALFLGTGTGITFGAASLYPDLIADGVELVPEIVEMMPHFKPQNFLYEHPDRLRIHVADARRFIKRSKDSYDVIVADLFHPARDGAGTLYTKEHFAAIRARLAQGGMFCQWLPLHQMDETMLRVVIRTFLEIFPNARAHLLHWSVDVPVLGLFAADPWPAYIERAKSQPLESHLKRLTMAGSLHVLGTFVAGPEALRIFAGTGPINTDDHQIVTYGVPRQRTTTSYGRLLAILGLESPPNDFIRARNVYLHGLVDEVEDRMDQAIDRYVESAQISSEFTSGYSRCLTLASSLAKDRPEAARSLLERLAAAQPGQAIAWELLERLFPHAQK